ncbi:hypothetical protein PtB15_1B479 [Puccinia triticina]|nr:hypothetical protein PtB15_1B479 [Puccinia triticina]
MPGFSLSHNRNQMHQNSPTPGSIHPIQSNTTGPAGRGGAALGLNHFGNANGMAVGHLPSSHSQTQQQLSNQQEASLDPSDFPALGAGAPSSTNPSHNALSYASHVNVSNANGLPSDRTVAATLAGQRTDFTPDDFPALDATVNQHHQQQQQQQQQLSGSEGTVREAREQASAAAALTAQMARLNVGQNKTAGMADSDNRNFPNKPPPGSNAAFHSSIVGSSHLSNGIGSLNSHHPLQSQPPTHLSLQSGAIPSSNSHLHSTLRSPIPPNLTSMQPHRPTNLGNYHSNIGLANVPTTLIHTPGSQNQSIQEPGEANSGVENRSGGSDPSSQPTPLLDHAGSLDSISQNANCVSSVVPFFAPQTPAEQVLFGPADRFGLMNLLQIIRHADADYSMLAMGKDLTHLGLDLGSSEALYPKFMSPWSDSKQVATHAVEPEFTLPACYHVQPQPVQTKLPQFHEETLFFIFYSQPRDLMQELAALELYKKNWRYHKELQLWLTKESGTGPMEKTPHYERGFYVFFDPTIWKRVTKEFVLQYDQLEAKPALATNPAALQAATQLSLVYTSNGPHGKNSLSIPA